MGRLALSGHFLKSPKELEALEFVKNYHSKQVRDTSGRPYLNHCLEVARIIHKYKYSEEYVLAGLLHDTVENTEATFDQIESKFGEEVTNIVRGVTEDNDPTLSWTDRKLKYIQTVSRGSEGIIVVSAVDKFHNVTEIFQDWLKIGDMIFLRYNESKEKHKWFFRSLTELYFVKGLFFENQSLLKISRKITEVLARMDM